MSLELQGFIKADFLANCWQRKSLFLPQGLPGFVDALSPDELAGLACEEDIESRIISGDLDNGFTLQHGPFAIEELQALPTRNWSLLVQAVDHYVPEIAALLRYFDFLPDWRIDDVMASFAPPGGSVGPHFDRYDVFLIQGAGRRRWRLGQYCDHQTPLLEHPDLHLLDHFEQQFEIEMKPGDVLYVPPGIAHWGESIEDSMTWSIGFRGPSRQQALSGYCDHLITTATDTMLPDVIGERRRHSAEITAADLSSLRDNLLAAFDNPDEMARWYGSMVTEKKYADMGYEPFSLQDQLPEPDSDSICCSADARLAFASIAGVLYLFFNGESRVCDDSLLPLIEHLCSHRHLDASERDRNWSSPAATRLLGELIATGVMYESGE